MRNRTNSSANPGEHPTKRPGGNDEARHFLRKMLLFGDAEIAASHQWLSEIDRWKELVFALLTRVTSLPQGTVRLVTEHMLRLDLLDIHTLASLLKGEPHALDIGGSHSRRIIQILQDGGFNYDEAVKGLTVVCEVAAALTVQFSGKIQLYLRSYALRILNETHAVFHLSTMKQEAVRYAFTLWLQNVLNMPVSLDDQSLESFSKAHGLTRRQIFDAADELDVSVALVDDLLHHFHSASEMVAAEVSGSPRAARTNRRKKSKGA